MTARKPKTLPIPLKTTITLTLALFMATANGNTAIDRNTNYLACLQQASDKINIPVIVLLAVKIAETGMALPAHITRTNKNGSVDHGIYQINDFWLPILEPYGIDKHALQNVCHATWSAALILRYEYQRHNHSWDKAIAHYHSPTLHRQQHYLARIAQIIRMLEK